MYLKKPILISEGLLYSTPDVIRIWNNLLYTDADIDKYNENKLNTVLTQIWTGDKNIS